MALNAARNVFSRTSQ